MRRIVAAFLALLGVFAVSTAAHTAENRGVKINIRASEATDAKIIEEVQLYANSHALVIGIDDYTNGWPRLSNAVKDAKLVAEALESKGFEVTLKLNVKAAELNRAFEEFYILKGDDPEARLFVWYAGHGHSERGEGFLVPADAPTPAKRAHFRLKSLALRRIGEFVRLAEAKHAFAIFDSCFSGTVFESARALPPTAVTRATTLPVRQFLTSGDAGQTVSDNGTFRELFLRALNGDEKADANRDGYVTASEMGLFLTDRVTNLTQSKQTPRYGKLRDKDWDRGDFVFSLPVVEKSKPKPKATQVATATRAANTAAIADAAKMQQESLFWESIKDSGDRDAINAYLQAYPNGAFAALAKVKLKAAGKAVQDRERALEVERKRLEAERQRIAAEADARRKAEEEIRQKAFAEERAKLAAERDRFAKEAEERRKADEMARQKAMAEERAKFLAERKKLEQQRLAYQQAQKEQQLAARSANRAETAESKATSEAVVNLTSAPYLPLPAGSIVKYTDGSGFKVTDSDGFLSEINDFSAPMEARELLGTFLSLGTNVYYTYNNQEAPEARLKISSEDENKLKQLWPLEIGKSVEIRLQEGSGPGQWWEAIDDEWTIKISVVSAELISALGKKVPTFVLKKTAASKEGRKFDETLWYHPSSGVVAKRHIAWSGRKMDTNEWGNSPVRPGTTPGDERTYELKSVKFPSGAKNKF